MRRLLPLTLLLACAIPCGQPASAAGAGSYDTCSGFITSLPAAISTRGVWCLRHHVATSISSGPAISVLGDDITIDCNGFKVGGLATGGPSGLSGISATNRSGVTVRDCNVRGFNTGIHLSGSRMVVEDNRVDGSMLAGIEVLGERNLVQRNRVMDIGGDTQATSGSRGISAAADILDNTVALVFSARPELPPRAIVAAGAGTEVRDNRVSRVLVSSPGNGVGIHVVADHVRVVDNQVSAYPAGTGTGLLGAGTASTFCGRNTSTGFSTGFSGCHDMGGNASP